MYFLLWGKNFLGMAGLMKSTTLVDLMKYWQSLRNSGFLNQEGVLDRLIKSIRKNPK